MNTSRLSHPLTMHSSIPSRYILLNSDLIPVLSLHPHRPRRRRPTSCPFSTTSPRPANPQQDHYAALSLSPSASGKEIKSQFYALSKLHHPDHTRYLPTDESSTHRAKFEQITEAYAVLGDPEKKHAYDRERAAATGSGLAPAAQSSRGGRPASGLSRRRSTFRGPPPSFYGSAARKRREPAGEAGQKEREPAGAKASAGDGGGSTDGRTRDDAASGWPFTTDSNDVPHFDRAGHYRTTKNVEEQLRQGRRKRRALLMQAREEAMARGSGTGADAIFPEDVGPAKEFRSFFAVAGMVLLGCGGGWMLFRAR